MPSQGPSFQMPSQGPSFQMPSQSSETTLMQREMDVMHEPYPTTCPQGVSEQPVSEGLTLSTSQPLIKLSKDVIDDTVKAAMKLIMCELFSNNMMTISKASKKVMLTKVIQDVVPRCFGTNVVFEDFILNKHHMHVANTLLDEQAEDTVKVDHFRGKACNKKFLTILNAMDNQMDDEQAEF
ncbi:hypothetical protein BDR04DRAFT_1150117 [Suillus decipiens]|nr:hypothetical protein BDR04DRAFT_1150117 [Suillus decipiens]